MSVYAINLLLFRIGREPELATRLREDAPAAFAEFDISPEEADLIVRRDGNALYELGVMPIALMKLATTYKQDPRTLFQPPAAKADPGKRA